MSGFFGGIIVANGEDDKNNYTQDDVGKLLDLSKHTDCAYNENGKLYYTNEKLIEIALNRTQYIATDNKYTTPPFIFGESTFIDGINCADQVVIPYKDDNSTRLIYDKSIEKYIYIKNSSSKTDMLNGETIAFTNAFILFADSTTYESSTDTELVIDTQSGGSGYYFHGGKMTEIRWKSSNGKLLFTNLMGEVLSVDPGNSYMSFFKSSEYSNITMS